VGRAYKKLWNTLFHNPSRILQPAASRIVHLQAVGNSLEGKECEAENRVYLKVRTYQEPALSFLEQYLLIGIVVARGLFYPGSNTLQKQSKSA
jgi:hypothetical protein